MSKKYIKHAVLAGLLMAFSWPTYGFPFLLFFAFVPLLLLEHEISLSDTISRKTIKIFALSYLCFFIFNAITTQWLFQVSTNKFGAYFMPLLANSFLMAITFLVYHLFKKQQGTLYGLVFFICIWIAFEKLHLEWPLNWPWLNLGNVFAEYHFFIQWYQYTGTLGGTLWILTLNALLFYYYKIFLVTRKRKILYKFSAIALIGISIPCIFSLIIYTNYKEEGKDLEVLLLQPDLDPYVEKYSKNAYQIIDELLQLTDSATANTQLIIAPETAFPGSGSIPIENISNYPLITLIKNKLATKKAIFISGLDAFEKVSEKGKDVNYDSRYNTYYKRYNAVIQLDKNKPPLLYYKSKLVPEVEYPVVQPLLGKVVLDFGGATTTLARPLEPKLFTNSVNSAKIAPLICYEGVFGEYTTQFVKKGANLITISTNDSWWDNSQGHKQLLAYSKLRALENKKYIARSANSGISAIINARGDVVSQLPYLYTGSLRGKVKLNETQTLYTKYGDYLATIALFLLGIFMGIYCVNIIKK